MKNIRRHKPYRGLSATTIQYEDGFWCGTIDRTFWSYEAKTGRDCAKAFRDAVDEFILVNRYHHSGRYTIGRI